jgi:acetoin utilization deacetylase AcuC-like enzyme
LSDDGLIARERLVVGACRRAAVPMATVVGGGYSEDIDALAARHALVMQAAAEAMAGDPQSANLAASSGRVML